MLIYELFFKAFGSTVHFYNAYYKQTGGGTKNLTHQVPQFLLSEASKAEYSLHGMFKHIASDHKAGMLSENDYQRYIRYYKLIINDPCILAKKIKHDPDIVLAARN